MKTAGGAMVLRAATSWQLSPKKNNFVIVLHYSIIILILNRLIKEDFCLPKTPPDGSIFQYTGVQDFKFRINHLSRYQKTYFVSFQWVSRACYSGLMRVPV